MLKLRDCSVCVQAGREGEIPVSIARAHVSLFGYEHTQRGLPKALGATFGAVASGGLCTGKV